jgi:hypothetical protein
MKEQWARLSDMRAVKRGQKNKCPEWTYFQIVVVRPKLPGMKKAGLILFPSI